MFYLVLAWAVAATVVALRLRSKLKQAHRAHQEGAEIKSLREEVGKMRGDLEAALGETKIQTPQRGFKLYAVGSENGSG